MKTLKQLREEYDSQFLDSVDFLPEEIMLEANKKTSLVSSTPSFKQMPALLLFRRMTYRKYPGDQTVALYYSSLVDKYLSIPFGPTGNLNLSEAIIHDDYELNEDLRKWFKEKWYKSKGGGWKTAANESFVLDEEGFDLDAVTNAVRSKESGTSGGYGAKSKSSSASGAYQYINKTWKGSASKYGVDTKQFPTARSAPKEVQDKVFTNDLQKNASKYGSLEKAVNVHYSGNPEGKVSSAGLKANRGQTAGGYMADIKKRVDDYNTERKSTMGAAQQMAANFSGGKTLSTPDSTQFAKAPEAPKPTQVASAEPPKMQNPDQERTKVASADTKKIAEDWSDAKYKSPSGGLTQAGVDAYNRKTGGNLKTAVTTPPSKLKKGSKAANRRKSFCARMGGMKKRLTSAKTARDPDSRINKALRKWNCEESFQNKLASIREERIDEFAPLVAAGGTALRAVGGSAAKTVLKTVGKSALSAAGKAIFGGDDDGEKARKAEATPSKGTLSTSLRGVKVKSKTPDLSPSGDLVAARQSEKLQQRYTEKSLKQMKENKMSDIRKMVRENVEYKDLYINGRSVTLNKNMAKRILEVYDSVNSTNKKLVENMLNEDMESFKKLLNFTIKA